MLTEVMFCISSNSLSASTGETCDQIGDFIGTRFFLVECAFELGHTPNVRFNRPSQIRLFIGNR
jgi:hypothetical protein